MERQTLTLGLFGFGCVGYGLYEVLERTPGLKASIKTICVKHADKPRPIATKGFTTDRDAILNDPEINVVVELIDDPEAAYDIVTRALKSGKSVVSANKKMIAEHFDELRRLQEEYGASLLYEAACCASIPIIRNLEEYYDNDLLDSIEGIVNGSTNYILTKTSRDHVSYADALADAQQKGYAESNPILDTGGFDAKYKLLILVAHAFGVVGKPEDIFHHGIDRLGDLELAYAREKGLKIKLLAHAHRNDKGGIESFVLPAFVDQQDPLFGVDDVFNGVKTRSCFSDSQFFVGRGAGAHPTASAVLSDLSALTYQYRYEYKKIQQEQQAWLAGDVLLQVFLRFAAWQDARVKASVDKVNELYSNGEEGYIIGEIKLGKLKDMLSLPGISVVVKKILG